MPGADGGSLTNLRRETRPLGPVPQEGPETGLELGRLVDALPGLVWTALPDGRADFVNRRWLDYTGMVEAEALGGGWYSAIHPDDLPLVSQHWVRARETGCATEVEARLRRRDGQYRRFILSAAPVTDGSGRVTRWCGINTDIEDRARAEEAQALKQITEAQRLSQTGSFTADVWADRHYWSEELYRIFEIDPGTTISVNLVRDMIHTDDLPEFDSSFARAVAQRTPYDQVFRIATRSGRLKHLHAVAQFADQITGRPLFIGAIRDVTESTVVENALRASEGELRRAYGRLMEAQRASKTGSFTWDVLADEHDWSDEIYRIFGFEPGTRVTMERIRGAIHADDMPQVEAVIALAAEGGDFEVSFRLADGPAGVRHARVVGRRMEPAQDRPVFIGAVQDVTASRTAEEALSQARAEIAHVARVTALGALAASIAHEVNQPLAGIITNSSTCLRMLAADPPNIDGARATAQRTLRDGNRASDVIKRLRALFSRGLPSVEPVDLNETAREVLAICSGELQRSGVTVRTGLADGMLVVRGDRVQLQQVILNLLLNASDALGGGGKGPREVLVATCRTEDGHPTLSVRDTGSGIRADAFERLFDPFYSTKANGMGIGLSVSRSIVEAHDGRLWATNNEGPGATFAFSLPGAAPEDSPKRAEGEPPDNRPREDTTRGKPSGRP